MTTRKWLAAIYDTARSRTESDQNIRPSIDHRLDHRLENKYNNLDEIIRTRHQYPTEPIRHQNDPLSVLPQSRYNQQPYPQPQQQQSYPHQQPYPPHQQPQPQYGPPPVIQSSQKYPFYSATNLVSASRKDPNIFGTPDSPFIVIYFSCGWPKVYLISETAIVSPSAYYYKRETPLDTITEYFLLFRYINDVSSLKWFDDKNDFIQFTATLPRLSMELKKHFVATLIPYQNMRILGFNTSANNRVMVPISDRSHILISEIVCASEMEDEKICRWIGAEAKILLDSYYRR